MNEAPETRLEIDLGDLPPLADERTAAKFLGLEVSTLRKWRTIGRGPRTLKVGRLVRYPRPELAKWLANGGEA